MGLRFIRFEHGKFNDQVAIISKRRRMRWVAAILWLLNVKMNRWTTVKQTINKGMTIQTWNKVVVN